MAAELHYKGFNNLAVTSFTSFIKLLRDPLEKAGHTVTWMPAHDVPGEFPFEESGLSDFDAVLISDVGADSFIHPDTWKVGTAKPNRLKMLRSWVEAGHGLGMIGGWMNFAGYGGHARYAFSPLAPILPVKVLPYDDRIEIPEGGKGKIEIDHPIFEGVPRSGWPDLMGYNLTEPRPEGTIVATLQGDPLLAVGEAGKGRVLAWTSDVSPAWCPDRFSSWDGYGRIFSQAVAWLAKEI